MGNKIDLIEERVVSGQEAKEQANSFGVTYHEVSAKENTNIKEMFKEVL